MRSCLFSLPCSLNILLYCVHLYGFTPVCIRSCVFRESSWKNALLQYVHLYGLTPIWIRRCLISLRFELNVFLQYLQRCVLRFASFLFCFFLSLFSFEVSLLVLVTIVVYWVMVPRLPHPSSYHPVMGFLFLKIRLWIIKYDGLQVYTNHGEEEFLAFLE